MKRTHWGKAVSALSIVIIAAVLTIGMVSNHRYKNPDSVIAWDVLSYYAYLPATFIEHDITLGFTEHDHAGTYWPYTAPNGGKVIKTSMGLSIMYFPFFIVAHWVAPLAGYEANGYTVPYAMALCLAALVYVVIGCVALRRLLLPRFGGWATAAVLLMVTLCTNLYWYTVFEGPMSHAFSFCLFALFALMTEKWHGKPTVLNTVLAGLCLGLLSLVRPTNGIVLLYFLLYGVTSWRVLCEKVTMLLRNWRMLALMAVTAAVVWVPQMLYWHEITGQLFFYSYGTEERFFFDQPKIWQGLFGFRKGWLIYTPVMLVAMVGLVPLWHRNRQYFWGIVSYLLLNVYIIFSWWCWWYGGSCGMRAMIDSYALLAIPMAAMVQWILQRKWVWQGMLLAVVAVLSALSSFHNKQYANGAIHWDSMTREAYFDSFLRRHPSDRFESLLQPPDYAAAQRGER